MAELNTPHPPLGPPASPASPPVVPQEGEATTVNPNEPVQVDRAVFLAARLRETLAELANLRDYNADLLTQLGTFRKENASFKAISAQVEINGLDADYDVGEGTVLQKRPDGTFWRIPQEALKQD